MFLKYILPGELVLTGIFDPLCKELSVGQDVPNVSSSPRLEENTRSREGSFNMHSTRDTGKQLNLICEG